MKPVSMWITLGMSLSIVLCTGIIAPTSAENSKNVGCTIPEYCRVEGYLKPTTTQPKPQNGTQTISVTTNSLTATVFIDGSGELFQTYLLRQNRLQSIGAEPEPPEEFNVNLIRQNSLGTLFGDPGIATGGR